MTEKLNVLFLCTGNSCRSQMAEGWARNLASDRLIPYSAGVKKHGLNPKAVSVMTEAGVDITNHQSKTVDEIPDVKFDYVFTVCGDANETCPYFPGGKIVHVGFDDPPRLTKNMTDEDQILRTYRRVRDEIKDFILNIETHIGEVP